MSSLKNYLLRLNIFEPSTDSVESEDEQQRRSNIVATRVYLVVLILVLIILALYSWLSVQTTIITLEHPTKDQFEALLSDAKCPCSRISLSYGEFTSLEASFHQVCSSDFVSDRWFKAIFSGSNSTYFFGYDIRIFGSAQFQALGGFCRLSKASVQKNIVSFGQSTLLSPQVLPETVLRSQTKASIEQFQLVAYNAFGTQLQLVREMTKGNQLIRGLQTNAILQYLTSNSHNYSVLVTFNTYSEINGSNCDCRIDLNCTLISGIFNIFGAPTQFYSSDGLEIPGISAGCLPVDSILSSALECLYFQTCVDEFISFFPTTEKFTAMTTPDKSLFNLSSTVKSMVDRLMVEEWMTNISYEEYYAQCAPISCAYSKVERHGFTFVLTKLISLLSGLTLLLGFVIPVVVRFIQRLRNPVRTPSIPCK